MYIPFIVTSYLFLYKISDNLELFGKMRDENTV